MSRPLILSNGRLLVGLDEHGLVHDFYYPFIGQDNLTTERSVHHKIGIWVDGAFSWVDDAGWDITYTIQDEALVTDISMTSQYQGISLKFHDFVDSSLDAFIRNITITNLRDTERDIRLFFHQVFQISPEGRGDTAMFVPDPGYVFTYKVKLLS
jgi:GH15 family glucan-1,4-alpha-glucosidase